MSENKSKYNQIKQHLQSLSINSDQFHDKLTNINQTRTKITNELANLTKDYDRKIKQLQNKLDDALSKNQLLLRQNSLYQKDIEAFQVRLVEKQKLITMLILQQNEKNSFSETVMARTKSQFVQKSDIKMKDFGKGKDSKKNYLNILPSNINEKDPQNNVQQSIQKQQPKNKESSKATNSAQHQLQNPSQIQVNPKQQAKQEVIKNNVPPPPPAKKNNKMLQKSANEVKKELTKVESQQKIVYHQQASEQVKDILNAQTNNQNSVQDHKQTLVADESQVIQQFEEQPLVNSQVEHPKPQQQTSQQRTVIPPPPAQKKKSAVPPPKRMPPPRKNFGQSLDEQQTQNFDQEMKNNKNMNIVESKHQSEQKQDNGNVFANMINDDNQIESNQNKQADGEDFFSQLRNNNGNQFQQNLGLKLNEASQVKNEAQYYNSNQQGQDFRTPPSRPLKQTKQQKKKIKTAPRPINQANFYEQASHSQSNSQQQQQPKVPQAPMQQNFGYQEKPSSEDFFAQFGSGASGFQQDFGSDYKGHHSQIIEAQQSSIDYADNHSVVSSTVGHMLQSQHLPEDAQSGPAQEQKKMKKKQPKRQIKSIDPDSFI